MSTVDDAGDDATFNMEPVDISISVCAAARPLDAGNVSSRPVRSQHMVGLVSVSPRSSILFFGR